MNKTIGLALDIDETLALTSTYWTELLMEKFSNPENLTAAEIISKYRYTQNVPYWQTEEAFRWMEEARESDLLQEQLPLIINANHSVKKINEIVPIVAYVTIRPSSVNLGTRNWLRKHDFPEAPIIHKPDTIDHAEGNKWKAKLLYKAYPQILGIIDDNPSVPQHLPEKYPGVVFLYDNDDHPRKDIHVIPCKEWSDVYTAVTKYFLH